MNTKKIGPDATNGDWQLFLLGYSNENVRKALILNVLTKYQLEARIATQIYTDPKTKETTSTYIVIEAVDPKNNSFVDFAKTFSTKTR